MPMHPRPIADSSSPWPSFLISTIHLDEAMQIARQKSRSCCRIERCEEGASRCSAMQAIGGFAGHRRQVGAQGCRQAEHVIRRREFTECKDYKDDAMCLKRSA